MCYFLQGGRYMAANVISYILRRWSGQMREMCVRGELGHCALIILDLL